MVSMATSTNEQWARKYMAETRLLNKVLSKYLQLLGSRCHFSIVPITSPWKTYCTFNFNSNFELSSEF